MITDAFAQAAGGAAGAPDPTMGFLVQFAPIVLILVVFYFLLIRPQQKRLKEHQAMLGALQRGDTIVTTGGFIGKVKNIADDELRVELAPNVEVRVVRSAVSEVRAKGAPPPANDSKADG